MRVNKQIRAPKVRVIGPNGDQLGVMTSFDALHRAEDAGLDLIEIASGAEPPVCKIIDYGKYRYDQTKREKENKKAQHQIKVKEVKVKPNIDAHDLQTKLKRAKDFVEKGCKLKVTCMFRGREMAHPEVGERVIQSICDELAEIATPEAPFKRFGRTIIVVLAPGKKKK